MGPTWHAVLWDGLGIVPFGVDDRDGLEEFTVIIGCLLGFFVVFAWVHARRRNPADVVDALGSVLAAGAVVSEVGASTRLFYVLLLGALGSAGVLRCVRVKCVVCAVAGSGDHVGTDSGVSKQRRNRSTSRLLRWSP